MQRDREIEVQGSWGFAERDAWKIHVHVFVNSLLTCHWCPDFHVHAFMKVTREGVEEQA